MTSTGSIPWIGTFSAPLRFVAAAALLAALGGCSGDDATGATTAPTTESPGTIETPPPTTGPTTNEPAATTQPPVTTGPTGAPPTSATIPDDLEQVRQDVIDAAVAAWQAYTDALRNPLDEDTLALLASTNSGLTLERRLETIAEVATSGLIAVEHPEFPASIEIYEDTVDVDPAAGIASVEYCRIGSDLGVEVGGNPDGTDVIVVDEVNAYHERAELTFDDGTWFDTDGSLVELFDGASTCDA